MLGRSLMPEQELNPPLSEPIKPRSAEGIQRDEGAAALTATHVLSAFIRRHKPMLERLTGNDTLPNEPALPAEVDTDLNSLLARAAELAATSSEKTTDLRHLGAALIERFDLASGVSPIEAHAGE